MQKKKPHCVNWPTAYSVFCLPFFAIFLLMWWKIFTTSVTSHELHGISCYRQFDCLYMIYSRITKNTSKIRITCPLLEESNGGDSPHKGPVMWEAFPCHDIIMHRLRFVKDYARGKGSFWDLQTKTLALWCGPRAHLQSSSVWYMGRWPDVCSQETKRWLTLEWQWPHEVTWWVDNHIVNTLRPEQNGSQLQTTFSKAFLNENHLALVHRSPVDSPPKG